MHLHIRNALLQHAAGLPFGAHKADVLAIGHHAGDELFGKQETLNGLLDINNVNPVPLAPDVRGHLRVPASRTLTEVNAGLDKILNQLASHGKPPIEAATPAS